MAGVENGGVCLSVCVCVCERVRAEVSQTLTAVTVTGNNLNELAHNTMHTYIYAHKRRWPDGDR